MVHGFEKSENRRKVEELSEVLSKYPKAQSLNWLGELLQREMDARAQNATRRRIQRAGFPEITSLENFDWEFNPKINAEPLQGLATLEFVKQRHIALFLGPPGTGKTHIALALGAKAAREGYLCLLRQR